MSDKEIEELRALVRSERRTRRGPFSVELRERLNAFLKRRWRAGESLRSLARELGLSDHTVQFWRSRWGERKGGSLGLRRVELIAERPLSRSLRRAIAYMGSLWDGLRVFLRDPSVSLDNNATERALRGIVVGRKNHYGSRSERGTEVAAILYSLIESAKLVEINPHSYLVTAIHAALRGAEIPLPHETR